MPYQLLAYRPNNGNAITSRPRLHLAFSFFLLSSPLLSPLSLSLLDLEYLWYSSTLPAFPLASQVRKRVNKAPRLGDQLIFSNLSHWPFSPLGHHGRKNCKYKLALLLTHLTSPHLISPHLTSLTSLVPSLVRQFNRCF